MSSPATFAGDGARTLPPLTYRLPAWEPTARPAQTSLWRIPAGLVMYALAIWLAVQDTTFRHFEAWLAAPVTGWVTGGHGATTSHDLVYFALGTPRAFGLHITQECTSALLLIPLLVMMGSFTIFSRLSLARELLAVAVGGALLLVVNIARVAGIAWATWRFGYDPGYTVSHVFVGSAMSLIGFVGALLLALWVLVRSNRTATVGRRSPGSLPMTGRAATLDGYLTELASLTRRIDDFEAALTASCAARTGNGGGPSNGRHRREK